MDRYFFCFLGIFTAVAFYRHLKCQIEQDRCYQWSTRLDSQSHQWRKLFSIVLLDFEKWGRTNVRTTWVQTMIITGRDCGSAEWIKLWPVIYCNILHFWEVRANELLESANLTLSLFPIIFLNVYICLVSLTHFQKLEEGHPYFCPVKHKTLELSFQGGRSAWFFREKQDSRETFKLRAPIMKPPFLNPETSVSEPRNFYTTALIFHWNGTKPGEVRGNNP